MFAKIPLLELVDAKTSLAKMQTLPKEYGWMIERVSLTIRIDMRTSIIDLPSFQVQPFSSRTTQQLHEIWISYLPPEWCGHDSHTLEVERTQQLWKSPFGRCSGKLAKVLSSTHHDTGLLSQDSWGSKFEIHALHPCKSQAAHRTAPIKIIHSDLLGKDSQSAQEQFHNSHSHSTFLTFRTLPRNPCKTRNRSYLHKADCAGSAARVH